MIRASDNPEQAFTAAYEQYADAIFRHCYFRLGHRERALELAQDTFMKAWEHIASGKDVEHVQAFLYRIAGNLIIDDVRRNKRRPQTSLEELQEEGFDPAIEEEGELTMQQRIDGKQLLETVQQLDEDARDVLVMKYVDGLPPQEIAAVLGVSANVISVRLHRAEKKLRSLVSP